MSDVPYTFLIGIGMQTALFFLGAYAIVIRTEAYTKVLQEKIEAIHEGLRLQISEMQREIKGMADIVVRQAIQSTRLESLSERFNILDQRLEDIRRGHGFIVAPPPHPNCPISG
jgi:hypothetical protein